MCHSRMLWLLSRPQKEQCPTSYSTRSIMIEQVGTKTFRSITGTTFSTIFGHSGAKQVVFKVSMTVFGENVGCGNLRRSPRNFGFADERRTSGNPNGKAVSILCDEVGGFIIQTPLGDDLMKQPHEFTTTQRRLLPRLFFLSLFLI